MLRGLMWGSLGLIVWAHVGYPLAAAAAARVRRFAPRRDPELLPEAALVIAAHDEEAVLEDRLRNALELDYPGDRLEIVVASDGSTDGTVAVAKRFAEEGIRVLDLARGGKVSAQNAAVRETRADVLAFSDANALWSPDALRLLVRNLADPDIGYVCGQARLEIPEGGDTREGLYWRFELWLREQEAACGSVTAGNGAVYAVRRSAYLELGPEHSHDIGLPFRLRRRGLRSVYEPRAIARERGLPATQDEWGRKTRMLSRAWWEVLHGGLLDPRGQPPLYYGALLSHRVLRYAAGPLHLVVLGASIALVHRDPSARALLAVQLTFAGLALAGSRQLRLPLASVAWYYALVSAASVAGLVRAVARGPHVTWVPVGREQ